MKDNIAKNLMELHGRIAEACEQYDRDADDIIIVAVTKTHPPAIIKMAVAAGIHNIGESRIQEAEPKLLEVGPIARFHMVGHLQTNKVKKAVQLFDVIQSVDSLKLAEEINRRAGEFDRTIECLIEVNCSGESQKYGVLPDECLDLVKKVNDFSNITLAGLMTVGPLIDDDETIRTAFGQCRDLYRRGQDIVGEQFDTLSMGMTDDFPLAIAEGATMIRIGSALFGPRQSSHHG
ncbi:MAG: YggS family pyridoxal phosphate-dependent enzyme [Candidatus Zixiibacteriota bacterium]|nr:MAG: YggS family pyridoxal phosphate-dependent enzyme [candidate division Zixibacteria bacterium]